MSLWIVSSVFALSVVSIANAAVGAAINSSSGQVMIFTGDLDTNTLNMKAKEDCNRQAERFEQCRVLTDSNITWSSCIARSNDYQADQFRHVAVARYEELSSFVGIIHCGATEEEAVEPLLRYEFDIVGNPRQGFEVRTAYDDTGE